MIRDMDFIWQIVVGLLVSLIILVVRKVNAWVVSWLRAAERRRQSEMFEYLTVVATSGTPERRHKLAGTTSRDDYKFVFGLLTGVLLMWVMFRR